MSSYDSEILAYRRRHEESVVAEDGWLSQIGLEWLGEGDTQLPIGTVTLRSGQVLFEASPDVEVFLGKEPIRRCVLRDDREAKDEILRHGRRSYQLVRRGDGLAIRVRDPDSPARQQFRGLGWYPIREEWRIMGTLEPREPVEQVQMVYTEGQIGPALCPGTIVFNVAGREHRLDPYQQPGDDRLLIVFKDETNGNETYSLCRYFHTGLSDGTGRVVLDFNRATNPVCALTPFVTCVLPPAQNRLSLRVEAGERKTD